MKSRTTLRELFYLFVFRKIAWALVVSTVAWLVVLSFFINESKRSVEKQIASMISNQIKFMEIGATNLIKSYEESVSSILDQMLDVMKNEVNVDNAIIDTYMNVYFSYFQPPFDETDYVIFEKGELRTLASYSVVEYDFDAAKDKIFVKFHRDLPDGRLVQFRFYLPESFIKEYFREMDFANVPFISSVDITFHGSNIRILRFSSQRRIRLFQLSSSQHLRGNFTIFREGVVITATICVDSLVIPGLLLFVLSVGTIVFLYVRMRKATSFVEGEIEKIDLIISDFQNGSGDKTVIRRTSQISEIDRTLDLIATSYEVITSQMSELQDSYARIEELYSEIEELSEEIREAFFDFSTRLASVVEGFEQETAKHIKRTQMLTRMIVDKLDIAKDYKEEIVQYAPLHDIGKIFVPPEILNKPGRLTDAEFEEVKRHTVYAKKLLTHPRFKVALNIALFHHENYNGTGYPFGLSGDEIPLEARIVKIVDVYDALRSDRPYKKGMSHEEALAVMTRGDGRVEREHFDPKLLEIFLSIQHEVRSLYEMTTSEVFEVY